MVSLCVFVRRFTGTTLVWGDARTMIVSLINRSPPRPAIATIPSQALPAR
jgi:hypothetical protein